MTSQERQRFWDTLCSLDGKDVQADRNKLMSTISFPQYLYRYRAVSLNTIDALQQNRLYFSNANYYDDPFDTLIRINFETIHEAAKQFFALDNLEDKLKHFAKLLGIDQQAVDTAITTLKTLNTAEFFNGVDEYLQKNVQSLLKQQLWTVCFSESGTNENMWLKYADQYKGFCLIYDLSDNSKMLCGTQGKCTNCVVHKNGSSLYPIYYSETGYDATEYAKNLTIAYIITHHLPAMAGTIIPQLPPCIWEPEKTTLIKSKCHEYDAEWRMILNGSSNTPVMREWIPKGIILGLKTTERDREIILRSAKLAGLEHFYESYIDNDYRIAIREIESNNVQFNSI